MILGTYLSRDQLECALACAVGYAAVCSHPSEIGVLEASDLLTLDMYHVLFDDYEAAIQAAEEHAARGGMVGVHSYHLESPALGGLTSLPNVTAAKNHEELLLELSRLTRFPGRVRRLFKKAARDLNREVKHVREDVRK